MSYTFVKVKYNIGDKKSIWLFKPKSEEQILEHWDKYPSAIIRDGCRILTDKVIHKKSGHYCNDFEMGVEARMQATVEPLIEASIRIENDALRSRILHFEKTKNIYLNSGMQVITIDERFAEIVSVVEKDVLTFPDEEAPSDDDVRYIKWDGGVHYYAKIGKLDVVDEMGNQKWDSLEEAKKAAKWYIEKYY